VARSGIRDLARIDVVEEVSPVTQLMVDRENMERVILNLVLNAIEAIEDEGVITIRTYEEKTQDLGSPSARRGQDSYVVISVSDTGCGMSQEFIRDRLFQPFQTTKDRGLGIGLYQCKAIIDACGGVINVQSRQGVGSTFTVKLPIQMMYEDIQGETIVSSASHSRGGGKELDGGA
jgi:signal transduction histidine kinase